MNASTKTTSLATLTEALVQYGWTFKTVEQDVAVPDPDSPNVVRSGWSGRARYVPTKQVPGVVVTASNEGVDFDAMKNFSASFTAEGKYLSPHTKGSYPFNQKGTSLKKILQQVEVYAPQAIADRVARRAAEQAEKVEQEAAEVLAAYTAAKEARVAAQHEAFNMLAEDAGLSTAQAEAVLVMVQTGKFGPLLTALNNVDRTGKGWLPGKSWVSGTYVDGVKVSDD